MLLLNKTGYTQSNNLKNFIPNIAALVGGGVMSNENEKDHVGMRRLCIATLSEFSIHGSETSAQELLFETTAYCFFCEYLLKCVSGKKGFQQKAVTCKISEFVGVSDEAFALLLLENAWDRMEDDAANGDRKRRKSNVPTKYTMNEATINQRTNNRKFAGWSKAGRLRYNVLCQQVENDRDSIEGITFEEKFMEYMRTKKGTSEFTESIESDDDEDQVHTYNALGAKRKREEEESRSRQNMSQHDDTESVEQEPANNNIACV